MVHVIVKTNSEDHHFIVEDDMIVRRFKDHIAADIKIETKEQMLSYDKSVLNDKKYLRDYVGENESIKVKAINIVVDVSQQEVESFISYGDSSETDTSVVIEQLKNLKKFVMIDSLEEAAQYVDSSNMLTNRQSVKFLKEFCLQLHKNNNDVMMYRTALRAVCLEEIIALGAGHKFCDKIRTDGSFTTSLGAQTVTFVDIVKAEVADQDIIDQEQRLNIFGLIDFADSKKFLLENPDLINQQSLKYLRNWSLQLYRDSKMYELKKVAFQYVSLSEILSEINEGNEGHGRVQQFYERLTLQTYATSYECKLIEQKMTAFIDEVKATDSESGYWKWFCRRFGLLALSGFLMMLTQNGKLLYISDNAAEYLGHSMEDLLIHGDSVYDIIDKQDHGSIQAELGRSVLEQPGSHIAPSPASLEGEHRMFLCRMNVSRNARRQMRFGDQKVVLVQGHYLSFLPLCSRNEPVFLATCTPMAMPEIREYVVQGATNVFTTIHSMDMKIVHVDKNGEFHLAYTRTELHGISWYQLLHWNFTIEAQSKHRLITQSEQDRSCILLVQLQRSDGQFIWVYVVLQVRDSQDSNQQPVIVCTNQVLSDCEASVMLANSWLYHYYSVHTKIQFGLPYEGSTRVPPTTSYYHHSPNIQGSLTHPYHLTYGFSSTGSVTTHQGSPGLISHHNGSSNTHHGSNVSNEHFRSHSYRIDTLQPIDYSQTTPLNIQIDSRYGTNKGNTITSGNPLKRKVIAILEPLYIAGSKSIIDVSTVELHSQHATDGGTLLLTIPTRHRFYTKVMPVDSTTEFMDQWNPSPPWSESAQKVPDIIQQELSPYLTTTPPTPTSAPLNSHTNHGPAFSFDWMPEQFVPVINNTTSTHNNAVHCQAMPNWSSNRLVSLDRLDRRLSDDDTRSE